MNRPPLEVADIVRAAGDAFIERSRKWITLEAPQSATGHRAVSHRRARRPSRSMLPLRTSRHLLQLVPQSALPEVSGQALATAGSQRAAGNCSRRATSMWSSRFRTSWLLTGSCRTRRSSTISCFAPVPQRCWRSRADPKHLGAEIGFFSVLHTWSQNSTSSACPLRDPGRWSLRSITHTGSNPAIAFFLPVKVLEPSLSRQVRRRPQASLSRRPTLLSTETLKPLAQAKRLSAPSCDPCSVRTGWSTAKPPFGGPQHVLRYLARYTHRVAISNHRLVSFADGQVTFRWRDSAHGNKQRLDDL